jgi:hypothetical protein
MLPFTTHVSSLALNLTVIANFVVEGTSESVLTDDQMQRCLQNINDPHFAGLPDLKLSAWIGLQRLAEEAGATFERSSEISVSLADPDVRLRIEQLCQKYHTWWNKVDARIMDGRHDARAPSKSTDFLYRILDDCVSLQQSQGLRDCHVSILSAFRLSTSFPHL